MALQFVGMIGASFATKYWQILLTHGLCVGLGSSFLYLPGIAVTAQYFNSKRMLASGIVAAGSSFGGFIVPEPYLSFGSLTKL